MYPFKSVLLYPLGKYPVVQLLCYRIVLFLFFIFNFFIKILFIYLTETARERGNTRRGSRIGRSRLPTEKPDARLDPIMPGSHPEPKADA